MHKMLYKDIYDYIDSLPVFSDHEHHATDEFFKGPVTLERLLQNSYVNWTGHPLNGTVESRADLLEEGRYNSYFHWFEKGLQKAHGIAGEITVENWDEISSYIEKRYREDKDFHWKVLKDNGFERLIQDSFWSPGDDCGHPEILTATFRIDKFIYGFHRESIAPDNFPTWSRYGFYGGSLDDYIELMRETIRKQRNAGKAVALKCAQAYHRKIYFLPDDKQAAEKAFGVHPEEITPEQRILFGNYVFNRCCELAAELDMPFQIHTGLARISGSNPMNLEPIIARHPRTRFVLFHSGFPWIHEVSGLAHNYKNALPSLTWTATISTSAAIHALNEYIDVASSINSITWGSDCFVPEDSIGAMLAWKFIVAKVLTERVEDKRLTISQAESLAHKFMYKNGRKVYGFAAT
jgi:predicted TIM-barrel fold metal-dependent hydrolase